MTATGQRANGIAATDRLATAIVFGFLIGRVVFALMLGPGVDESYTLAISRTLNLSYFDHPPLHQWIAHFAAAAFGEGIGARAPFILLFAATGWIYYRLTDALFGARAAIVALFALNVAPFFFAAAGTWIVPDGPLLFGLAAAAWALARLFFSAPVDRASIWGLWLVAGAALGLAGLSKYSAVLSLLGLLAFVILSPQQRRWFADPAPYIAATVAAAMMAPVIAWNARHGWVSLGFQAGRGIPGGGLKPAQFLVMALGQIAFLLPWIAAALVMGLVAAWRKRHDERRLFLLCLALPPILVFTVTPLWGGRGQPHWTMPGWFFAFALMGAWIEDRRVADWVLRRWTFASVGLLAAVAAIFAVQTATGWPLRLLPLRAGVVDPTLESFDWGGLREAPVIRRAPSFVLAVKWSDAGKIALALGPKVPVFVISNDPRGWAFVAGGDGLIGRDGVLAARASELASAEVAAAPLARSLGNPEPFALTRNGEREIALALVPVRGLTSKLPLPYPVASEE